ncbi:MAG: hypothetical protein Q7J98_08230 [Kiritimatiellia bacterium]|nr:hypothetical protein [Kiritimatiellia bacterium]
MKNLKTLCIIALLIVNSVIIHAETQDGIQLFKRHYMEKGNYKDMPLPGETVDQLLLSAAQGEYEPTMFLMRSAGPVKDVEVVLTNDLECAGHKIDKNSVDIRVVEDQKRWLDTRRFVREPYLLMKKDRFDLKPDETTRIWLTVHVPSNAAPGNYSSAIRINSGNKLLKEIPVTLTVRPFKLLDPGPDKMMRFMYFGNSPLPVWGRNLEYLTKMYKDMKEHGMNSISCYSGQSMDSKPPASGTPEKHWSSLTDVVQAMKAGGLLQKGSAFIWMYAWSFTAPYLTESHAFLEKQGIEVFLYGQDEPSDKKGQDSARYVNATATNSYPKAKMTTAICEDGIKEVGDIHDAWICAAMNLNDHMRKLADKKKKILWSYDCALAPTDPLTSRHYFGFHVWRTGANGASLWHYSPGGSTRFGLSVKDWDSYNPDYQHPFDFAFCAPAGPIPSVGWEGVREGVDDYRYIFTLEDYIARAETAGKSSLAETGKQLLKELRSKINPENYRKAWEVTRGTIGYGYVRPAPEPQLTIQDYDAYRERIAQEIIKISKGLEN